jgi:hypothetical protein
VSLPDRFSGVELDQQGAQLSHLGRAELLLEVCLDPAHGLLDGVQGSVAAGGEVDALAPAVARMLERSQATGGDTLRKFLHYGEALVSADPSALDLVVEPDARLHDLEAMGLPPGLAGLKLFRQMINSAFPDERPELLRIELEGNNIVAAELKATGTHRGELMGIPPTVSGPFDGACDVRCSRVGGLDEAYLGVGSGALEEPSEDGPFGFELSTGGGCALDDGRDGAQEILRAAGDV